MDCYLILVIQMLLLDLPYSYPLHQSLRSHPALVQDLLCPQATVARIGQAGEQLGGQTDEACLVDLLDRIGRWWEREKGRFGADIQVPM